MTTSTEPYPWRLRHAWNSDSDRTVLAMCAQRLADAGVQFGDAASDAEADAFKLHGFELVEAHGSGTRRFVDLREVADTLDWANRVDLRAWKFMRHDEAVFGIPIAIHQSNGIWANRALADRVGAGHADLLAWLRAASRRIPKPLVVGREPWQIGILFETLYARRGVAAYRQALVDLDPQALGGEATAQVLEEMLELRALVDERGLDTPWRTLLQQIDRAEAGAMAMGDWVSVAGHENVARVALNRDHVHVVDFFVPAEHGARTASLRVAALLTDVDFQERIAKVKGSASAVRLEPKDPASADRIDFPSFTFDQCAAMRPKLAVLDRVAEHFLGRLSSADTAHRLADVAAEG